MVDYIQSSHGKISTGVMFDIQRFVFPLCSLDETNRRMARELRRSSSRTISSGINFQKILAMYQGEARLEDYAQKTVFEEMAEMDWKMAPRRIGK